MRLKSLMVAAIFVAFPAMALAQAPDTTSTKRIEHAQDQQSKSIYRERHDKQTAK